MIWNGLCAEFPPPTSSPRTQPTSSATRCATDIAATLSQHESAGAKRASDGARVPSWLGHADTFAVPGPAGLEQELRHLCTLASPRWRLEYNDRVLF